MNQMSNDNDDEIITTKIYVDDGISTGENCWKIHQALSLLK